MRINITMHVNVVKYLNLITFTFIFYINQSNIYLALNDQLFLTYARNLFSNFNDIGAHIDLPAI